MKNSQFTILALLGLAVGGCGDPSQVVDVTPPGQYINRVPPEETGLTGPQALGESAAATTGGPVSNFGSTGSDLADGVRKSIQTNLAPKEAK